jgi:hypothetical protein
MPNIAGLDRLKSQLLTSGLSQQNQPLFQVINQLIDYLRSTIDLAATAAAASSGSGSTVNQFIQQILLEDGGGGGDEATPIPGAVGPSGGPGATGADGAPGSILFLNEPEDADWFPPIMGPQGNPGAQGTTGAAGPPGFSDDGVDGEAGIGSILPVRPTLFSNGAVTVAAFQDTATDIFNSQIALGIGDVLVLECFGIITNNSVATKTYTILMVLGAKTITFTASTTVAAAAITAVHIRCEISLMATNLSIWVQKGRLSPSGATDTIQTDAERTNWTSDTTNFSGLQTAKIQARATAAGASSSFQGGYYVERRPLLAGS